jgi:hypothetical protein
MAREPREIFGELKALFDENSALKKRDLYI